MHGLADKRLWKTCGKTREVFHRVIILILSLFNKLVSFPQIYCNFSPKTHYFSTDELMLNLFLYAT
jgi:hypothetical protein